MFWRSEEEMDRRCTLRNWEVKDLKDNLDQAQTAMIHNSLDLQMARGERDHISAAHQMAVCKIAELKNTIQINADKVAHAKLMQSREAMDRLIETNRRTHVAELTAERDRLRSELDAARDNNESLAVELDKLCTDFRGKLEQKSIESLLDFTKYNIAVRCNYSCGVVCHMELKTIDSFRVAIRDLASFVGAMPILNWSIEAKLRNPCKEA